MLVGARSRTTKKEKRAKAFRPQHLLPLSSLFFSLLSKREGISLSFFLSETLSSATMARRYDSRTTIFSPEGRLYQVEYAMEAISNAGAALGVLASDGVVLAAEKRITSKVRR